MDWSHHSLANEREPNKIYEDSYISSWGIEQFKDQQDNLTSERLVAKGFEKGMEKARYIDCANSNKYNITQDIAEAFEVFCQYEYKCDSHGRFIKDYFEEIKDENGNVLYKKAWTGRKVIFYNRAIKSETPLTIEYRKNLDTISRSKDSSELFTKLYITPIESSTMDTGYISIADTALNPTLDDFILNFDYLYQTKSISQYQMNFVKTYEVEIHKLNQQLINLAPHIEDLTVEINDLEVKCSLSEKEKASAQTSLDEYQTLRDSEVMQGPVHKHKDNPFSVIFIEDGENKKAAFRLTGVDIKTHSISGYSNYTYSTQIFNQQDIETVSQIGATVAGDTKYYLVLDEYGYPEYIYTNKDNPDFKIDNSSIIYLDLWYSPYNAYVDICEQLQWIITNKETTRQELKETIKKLQEELDDYITQQDELLKNKELLNQKLERVLGPALREGYWTPDTYEDPGESKIIDVIPRTEQSAGPCLIFDKEPFEGETSNFYYASIEDQLKDIKSYYDYLDISTIYQNWNNNEIDNLTIHLKDPFSTYKVSQTLSGGNYYITYNGINYYYTFSRIGVNSVLALSINDNGIPQISINNGTPQIGSTEELVNATDLTYSFEGMGHYLGERLLYNNAGFIFSFLEKTDDRTGNKVLKPVLLLNNQDIRYDLYKKITYSFSAQLKGTLKDSEQGINYYVTGNADNGITVFPRIIIRDANVNYKSDKLKIIPYETTFTEETQALENYVDYSILIRGGRPHFNLKITNKNNLITILQYNYCIEYRISRANEMLYLDAKNVAKDNSYPKYSYELKVSNIPSTVNSYELGQLVYINDYEVGIHAASGYISGIKLKLSKPHEDEIEIKNYKTKFEDLFSTITASSEAMRNNQIAYNIAAGSFNSDGTIQGSVLQNSILNNSISMSYSNTNVVIDDIDGITLTNQQPYLNGVYGQVKLMGGGIFLSNAIDASGARIWNTGITPNGINAALITTGQLDVEKIRIFAGNNIAFQWNGEGIFAYKQTETGVDENVYVKYSSKGLQFVSGKKSDGEQDNVMVDLGWNGLLISTQEGATELTGDLGLTIYNGPKAYRTEEDTVAYNHVVRLGKFVNEDRTIDYGLRLYKRNDEDEYVESLVATNGGDLWLKEALVVGESKTYTYLDDNNKEVTLEHGAGIAGTINNTPEYKSVRFWAGSSYENKLNAPFRVLQDGTLYATKALIKGSIEAESGKIGGWNIEQNKITSNGISLNAGTANSNATIIVGDVTGDKFVQINGDGSFKADGVEINGTINATGGSIGNLQIADINESLKRVVIELSSSNGNITKFNEDFETIFTITIKKGGMAIKDEEYDNYEYNWLCSSDGVTWSKLPDSDGATRTVNYSEKHTAQRYVKCEVSEKEVGVDGGDNI